MVGTLILALASPALAAPPSGLDAQAKAHAQARAQGAAGGFPLDQVIIKLTPEAGREAHRALRGGFAAAMPNRGGRELDAALRRRQVHRFERVFKSFGDAQGRRVDTARARVMRSHDARARRRLFLRGHPPRADRIPALEDFFVLHLPELGSGAALEALLGELSSLDAVEFAQPNYVYTVDVDLPPVGYLPDDPFISTDGTTWSEGSFANAFPDLYGLRNVHVLEAWDLFDTDGSGQIDGGETAPGEGVVVAVIDTGIDPNHPDIASGLWANPGEIPGNGVDDEGNGFIDDVYGWDFVDQDDQPTDFHGHGTHVSGTIAARADNGEGIAGVAPFATIMALKGLSDGGSGNSAGLAAAVEYAMTNGADVTSNSWGGGLRDSVIEAAFDAAEAAGVLSIAAAGNNGRRGLSMPALFPSVVSVAAVDSSDLLASFSNFGTGLDVAAPGVSVLSLSANDHANALAHPTREVGARYLILNGTSMATPHASGVAAVLMSLHPVESNHEVRGRMLAGAQDISAMNPGADGGLGAGRVDLLASAQATPQSLIRIVRVANGPLAAQSQAQIDLDLRNFWLAATDVEVTLRSDTPLAHAPGTSVALGDWGSGETKTASFGLRTRKDALAGDPIPLTLEITGASGLDLEVPLVLHASYFEDVTDRTAWVPAAVLGSGASFEDINGDGLGDFATGSVNQAMRFHEQQSDGTFTSVRAPQSIGSWPVFADINADGHRDLYQGGASSMMKIGDGTGTYTALPPDNGANINVNSACVVDLEGDHDIDLVTAWISLFNGSAVSVLQNNGDETFTNVTTTTGIPNDVVATQVLCVDYDGDGHTDVLTTHAGPPTLRLYQNDGTGFFTDVTASAIGTPSCPLHGNDCGQGQAIAAGDYDNDGDLDLYQGTGSLGPGSPGLLWRNEGGGVFTNVTDSSGDLGTTPLSSGRWGTAFFDLDNDADLDLFVAFNGVILGTPDRVLSPINVIFRNEGDGTFTDISATVFPQSNQLAAFVATIGDYDADGGLDILGNAGSFVIEQGGLLRNTPAPNAAWLELELDATASTPDGLGARVFAETNGVTQLREVHHSGMETWLVHFGLGAAEQVDRLEILWPSGLSQVLRNVPRNQRRSVREMDTDCGGGSDDDADGVCNVDDNCLYWANGPFDAANQVDSDGDGFGNLCDLDFDNDGYTSLRDTHLALGALDSMSGDPAYLAVADLDADGVVTRKELERTLTSLGNEPGPSGLSCADASGATAPCLAD